MTYLQSESLMKYIILAIFVILFSGCSRANLEVAFTRTKDASFTAVTDPLTWAPLATGVTLYATKTDEKATDHILKHPILNSHEDNLYREINGLETYVTAILIDDNDSEIKLKRIAVETLGFATARETTDILNSSIKKENPSKTDYDSLGSHHAIDPFAGSAMNRRNVDQLSISTWGKYSLNTLSYLTASASAWSRVEDGGHSLGDQFINISIGNFLGLFLHDLFMQEDTHLKLSLQKDSLAISTNWNF